MPASVTAIDWLIDWLIDVTTVTEREPVKRTYVLYWLGTVFTFVACCYKHDICISRIVTQNTLKGAISRAKFQNFSGEGHRHHPTGEGNTLPTLHPSWSSATRRPRPVSTYPGSATGAAQYRIVRLLHIKAHTLWPRYDRQYMRPFSITSRSYVCLQRCLGIL